MRRPLPLALAPALALANFVLIACGGDGDPAPAVDASPTDTARPVDAAMIDAPYAGTATITGRVAEQSFEPTTAFLVRHPIVGYRVLAMNEGGPSCHASFPPGLSALIGFPCGDPEARTYTAKHHDAPCEAGAPHVWILVEHFQGEFPEYEATAGTATITAAGPTLAGTFDATFGTKGALTGTYDAILCP